MDRSAHLQNEHAATENEAGPRRSDRIPELELSGEADRREPEALSVPRRRKRNKGRTARKRGRRTRVEGGSQPEDSAAGTSATSSSVSGSPSASGSSPEEGEQEVVAGRMIPRPLSFAEQLARGTSVSGPSGSRLSLQLAYLCLAANYN